MEVSYTLVKSVFARRHLTCLLIFYGLLLTFLALPVYEIYPQTSKYAPLVGPGSSPNGPITTT